MATRGSGSGRPPILPHEYEQAICALRACTSIDESRYWSDKAEAIAAWAKIYRSKDADILAKRLKLHAYRRMGELAQELRPGSKKPLTKASPGPASLLRENGLSASQATDAVFVGRLHEKKFIDAVKREIPPSPTNLRLEHREGKYSDAYEFMLREAMFAQTARAIAKRDPKQIAKGLDDGECQRLYTMVCEVSEWFDALEHALSVREFADAPHRLRRWRP